MLSTTDAAGDNFKVLGIEFDPKLSMLGCIQTCLHEAAWRYRSLLRTHRFFTDAELLGLFKAHVLSFVEYRAPGVYHAASSNLASLNAVLSSFLRNVGICEIDALTHFKLALLSSRFDIAMLGVHPSSGLRVRSSTAPLVFRARQASISPQCSPHPS